MKRKIILSIAFAAGLTILSLTASDSSVAAQSQIKIVADTGMITLGANQVLRVIMKDGSNSITLENYVVRRIEYSQDACGSGICKHTISSQNATAPIALAPNESLQVDLDWSANVSGVRIVVLSKNQSTQATAMIIDGATGEVVSAYVLKDILISS